MSKPKSLFPILSLSAVLLLAGIFSLMSGCKEKPKELSDTQQLEIRELRADASFAVTIKDYVRAEASINKALEINNTDADLWITLGAIQKRAGKEKEAKKSYKKGLKCFEALYKATGKPIYLAQRGWALGLLGDMDAADKALKKAAAMHPDDPDVKRLTSEKGIPEAFKNKKFREISLLKDEK